MTKRLMIAAVLSALIGASAALATAVNIAHLLHFNQFTKVGFGDRRTFAFDGTLIVDRFDSRGRFYDTGPKHPSLWARTEMSNTASAFRASSKRGIDAVIGNHMPSGTTPDWADRTPSLYVGDTRFNTGNSRNDDSEVNEVAIEARGAIRLCGRSQPGDSECTSSVYLYLQDGTGDLVAKWSDGSMAIVAAAP